MDLSKFCIGHKDDMQPPIYDLYAVINHYGGMIGGHYTAYARMPNDKNSQRSDVGMLRILTLLYLILIELFNWIVFCPICEVYVI